MATTPYGPNSVPLPQWHDMLPHLITACQFGVTDQKKAAMDELYKLADFADAMAAEPPIDAPPPDEAEAPRPESSVPPPEQRS